jgi:hypothetical protein
MGPYSNRHLRRVHLREDLVMVMIRPIVREIGFIAAGVVVIFAVITLIGYLLISGVLQ